MDEVVAGNRAVWEQASTKHVREYDELLEEARGDRLLHDRERELLAPVLAERPLVVHLQSGHGLDDVGMVKAGARAVIGVDYSSVAAGAAQRRAAELGLSCHYAVAEVPGVPVRDACADLVYTGKGALVWMRDINAWARDVARVVRPGGHLFVYEGHPAVPLWSWDEDEPRIRPDRSYFAESHTNDTFPGNGARESQWTLGQIVTAITTAGLHLQVLEEYAEPFWRPQDGTNAAAWSGRLPNSYALLARRPLYGGRVGTSPVGRHPRNSQARFASLPQPLSLLSRDDAEAP